MKSQENALAILLNTLVTSNITLTLAEIQLSVILKYTWTLFISIKWSNFCLFEPLSAVEFTYNHQTHQDYLLYVKAYF